MPPFELTVAMPGLQPLTVGLSRLREDISDWRPFWTDTFVPSLYRLLLEGFVTEGSATGGNWAALNPEYAAWKARHYPGQGILVRSGAFKASVTNADAPDAIVRMQPMSVEVGSSVPYGRYHQYGTRKMPQRPALRVTPEFMRATGQALHRYVQQAWMKRRSEAGGTTAAA